ncbi:MAG: ATP-binding cassette domain-containing protein [Bdellovibrionota bacterium]
MIEVQKLVKNYGNHVALRSISFKVAKGEIVGLLGPNGAGKSTTMKILSGFMPATSGEVTVAGHNVLDNPLEVKRNVGYLPEHPPVYPELRVREYLDYVASLKQVPSSEIKAKVDFVIEKCGLKNRATQIIGTLSKGYQQRVGIAQALVHSPQVVILDEPTVGLDPVQIVEIRNLIKSLAEAHTVILSTHILPEVVMTCNRVLLINRGQILVDGSVESLTKGSGESLEQAYLRIVSQDVEVMSAPTTTPA